MLFRHMSDLPLPPRGADTARRTRRRAPRVAPTLRAAVAATLERLEERIVMSTALEGDADVFLLEEPLVAEPVEPITADPLILDPLIMPPPEEPITSDALTEPLVTEEPATSVASTTNLPPVAVDDYFEMDEDTVLVQSVLGNDYDPEGDTIRAVDAAYPSFEAGSLDWEGETGRFTFRPNANFNGLAFFTYFLLDSGNKSSHLATVKIKVKAVNDAPTLEPIAGQSVGEGSAVSFSASAFDLRVNPTNWDSDVPSESPGLIAEATAIEGTSLTYSLVGAPAGAAIDPVTGLFSWAAADAGVHTFDVVATDNGSPALSASRTVTIEVSDVVPTAAIGGATAGSVEGSAIAMTSIVTGAGGGADTFTYEWVVMRDGAAVASGTSADFSFTPDDNGTYSVNLLVTDDDGAAANADVVVTVSNAAPMATITDSPDSAAEGSFIGLVGAVTDPGKGDTHTYAWEVKKDGVPYHSSTGPTLDFLPGDNGSYVVTLVITDDDLDVSEATSATIDVLNVAPTVVIDDTPDSGSGGPAVRIAGEPIKLMGHGFDPGFGDTLTYAWSVTREGASFATGSGSAFTFTPDVGGTYAVRVTVSDDDGGTDTDTASIFVINVVAVDMILAPSPVDENGVVTLSGNVGGGDVSGGYGLVINWSDGTTSTLHSADGSFSVPHQYLDDNVADAYAVSVVATDSAGRTGSARATIGVRNVAPVAAITNFVLGAVHPLGTSLPLTGRFTDAGTLDTHTASFLITSPDLATPISVPAVVNADGTVSANYSFDQPGVYQLWLTVIDDDGGMATVGTVGTSDAVIMIADAVVGSTEGKTIGGGWYYSAAGSYAPNATLTGRAYFSFVAKYEEGDSEPQGRTMFKFRNLLFRSNGYDSLDIDGDRASIQGVGSINGAGSYGFRITVIDGSSNGGDCDGDNGADGAVNPEDRIRVQIWNLATGAFVYDTHMGDEDDAAPTTELDGGSVHVWA